MTEQILGVYKDIGQFIIGTLVSEDEDTITLKRSLLTTVEANPSQPGVIPRFYPASLLSIDPPFHVIGFLKAPPSIDFPITLRKNNLLRQPEEVSDQMKELYLRNFIGVPPEVEATPQNPKSPEDNIVNLY